MSYLGVNAAALSAAGEYSRGSGKWVHRVTHRSISQKPLEVPEPLTLFLGVIPSGNQVSFSKSADAFAFEEDSSSDGLSPDQTRSEDPQGSVRSPPDTKATETPSAGPPGTIQVSRPHLSLSSLCSLKANTVTYNA